MMTKFKNFFAGCFLFSTPVFALPPGFVYLNKIDPTIIQDIKYAGKDNFVGRPIKAYRGPQCILTIQTAEALANLQKKLNDYSLSLKVFDGYRPVAAVNDFIAWSSQLNDLKMKLSHYPNVDKKDFFKLGYVAKKSAHSRGSTVDLTLVDKKTGKEIDMGTPFDFMDELSHTFNPKISKIAQNNRLMLRKFMVESGFKPINTEWWHFTLINEPFPEQYFNFTVK